MHSGNQVVKRVAEIYNWLDSQRNGQADLSGECETCGKCCDLAQFGHRLFVSTPEMLYLTASLDGEAVKPMPTGRWSSASPRLSWKCVSLSRAPSRRIMSPTGSLVIWAWPESRQTPIAGLPTGSVMLSTSSAVRYALSKSPSMFSTFMDTVRDSANGASRPNRSWNLRVKHDLLTATVAAGSR